MEHSYEALKDNFKSKDDFISFFEAIESNNKKNLFLKTTSFYLFLAKNGDWFVDVENSDERIDYFTDTYKYIAIFSLIESLGDKEFLDFYQYLVRRKTKVNFPIQDKNKLEEWYRQYKLEYGSINSSVKFFKSLSEQSQNELVKNLEVKNNTEASIDNLSKYLYYLRSKFVHEAELIVNMSGRTTISRYNNKFVVCKLSLSELMKYFEEGLITYFTPQEYEQTNTPDTKIPKHEKTNMQNPSTKWYITTLAAAAIIASSIIATAFLHRYDGVTVSGVGAIVVDRLTGKMYIPKTGKYITLKQYKQGEFK